MVSKFNNKILKKERLKLRLNRPQFIKYLSDRGACISPPSLVNWEDGYREPNGGTVRLIANALNKPMEYFYVYELHKTSEVKKSAA